MKKGYVFLTAVFIMGILVMTSGQAAAGWMTSPTAVTVLSNANSAKLYNASPSAALRYDFEGSERGLTGTNVITLTLTGGATWANAAMTTTPSPAGYTWTALSAPLSSTIQFVGTTSPGAGGGQSTGVTFNTGGSVNLLNATSSVDVLFSISAGSTPLTQLASLKAYSNSYVFVPAAGISVTNNVKEATLDVMAIPAYSKFENSLLYGGTYGSGVNTGLYLTHPFGTAATTIPEAPLGIKKVLITLSGDFTDVTKVTVNSALTGCDSAGVTTSGTAGQFLIVGGNAYATNTGAFSTADFSPNFFVLGTTAQTARSFTAKVENFVDGANYLAYTWISPVTNYKFVRNGTFFSANSLGIYNTVKISDLSGAVPTGGAKVLISAWDVNGVRLADASGLTDILLQNNQTISLTGDQIAARFVGTAMKYEVAVQSKNSLISNVKKTPDGFGSNVYTNTVGGGAL